MNLWDISLLNLRRRKSKALFVLAGLVAGVATLVALVSLSQTLSAQVNQKLEKYGANILITPRSESLALSYEGLNLGGFAFKTREIKQADLALLSGIPNAANLAAVGPMVLGAVEPNGKPAVLAGVDFKAVEFLKPWWKPEGSLPGDGELLAGSEAARVLGLQSGDTLSLGGRKLKLSGVLHPTGSQDDSLLFAPLALAQDILHKPGLVSMVEVAALCKDCPVDDMVKQIGQVLPGAKVTAIQSVVKSRMQTIAHFKNLSLGISGLVAVVGALVVLVTMMASVKERTIEIGVFRALGFRKSQVMRVILGEAFVLSSLAGILGFIVGLGASQAALPWLGQGGGQWVSLDPALGGLALAMSLLVGLASALYPALLAARLDPHEALRAL